MSYFPSVVRLLKEEKADDICVIGGGTIPEEDRRALEEIGVSGNFGPGTATKVIIDHIVERVGQREELKNLRGEL